MSLEPLRCLFQQFDDEGEANGHASFATISFVQTGFASANMADNNNNDDLCCHMETYEQTFRTQQKALNNIQHMLAQLLNNQNNDETGDQNNDETGNQNNDLF